MKKTEFKDEWPPENARIWQLIVHYSNGNVASFVEKLNGVSHQVLNRIFNIDARKNDYPGVSSKIISAIASAYPEVDQTWLLTGQGKMLKSLEESVEASIKTQKPFGDNYQTLEDKEPSPMVILDRLSRAFIDQAEGFRAQAEAFKAQTELLVNIKMEMAREKTQAIIEKQVKETEERTKRIEASLSDLPILKAQFAATVRREAERFANEDQKKTKAELHKISKYVAQILGVGEPTGIHPGASI